MGLIAEWNRTDLTQLVDASTPQFTNGAGAPTLTVEAVAERGNVLRYNGDGTDVEHCFMFSVASGLLVPTTTERRDFDIELELYDEITPPASWGMGVFFMGDLDSPAHGFAHLGVGNLERQRLLNNTAVESVTGGSAATRMNTYQVRGRKPAAAAPEVSSYYRGWSTSSGTTGEPRRSGSTSAARGAVTAFGSGASSMGATWNGLTLDRIGLWFMTAGGGAAPDIDILNIRILDPFTGGAAAAGTAPVVTFVPATGTPISPTSTLTVDVTDADGDTDILLTCMSASFATGIDEVVFRAGIFRPTYSAGSTVTPIADGNRFVLARAGGWPATVTIDVDVVDAGGNVV